MRTNSTPQRCDQCTSMCCLESFHDLFGFYKSGGVDQGSQKYDSQKGDSVGCAAANDINDQKEVEYD
jgi:hypothetical protein